MKVETIDIQPRSGINTWNDWPEDVVEQLRKWNKRHQLSFRYLCPIGVRRIFKCSGCLKWNECGTSTTAIMDEKAFCDSCMIIQARFQMALDRKHDAK